MAVHAESSIQLNTIPAYTSLLGGHFYYKSTATTLTPQSANVIQNVSNSPSEWQYNTHIGSNGIKIRYNEIDLSEWSATNGLKLYYPVLTNGVITNSQLGAQFTASDLSFYKPGGQTASAVLNSNGLNIVEGSMILGSEDSTTHRHPFEVNSNGSLYAIDATIAGGITATSLTVTPNAVITDRLDNDAIEVGGRNLLSQNDMIVYPSGDTKAYHIDLTKPLQANTTYVIQLWDINNILEAGYIPTTDTEVQTDVAYYSRSGEDPDYIYTLIEEPTGNPQAQGWYVIGSSARSATINVYYCNDTTISLAEWHIGGTEEHLEGKFTTSSIIVTPEDYHLTNDTTVNPNKSYYEYVNDTYVLVENISEGVNPHDLNYYENRGSNGFIVIQKNTAATALTIGLLKLEQGNKATDWTVAPEDTEENLSNSIDTLENSNGVIQNSINILNESNSNLNNYVRNHIKIDSNSGLIIVNEASDSRLQLTSDNIKLFAGQQQVAIFGPTIILGDAEAQNIKLSSSKLGFYQKSQEVAYIGSEDESDTGTNRLFIQEAQLLNHLYIGPFMWKVQSDKRISLVYSPPENSSEN